MKTIKEYVEGKVSSGDIRPVATVQATTHDDEIWFGYTIQQDRKGRDYEDGNYGYIFIRDIKYGWSFLKFSYGDVTWKRYICNNSAMNTIDIERR